MSTLPPSTPPYVLQGSKNGANPAALKTVTSPILIPQGTDYRLRHFPETVYNLTPQSHLVKLMRVLTGDAGTGQFRKRMLINRLGEALTSSYFFDLDGFWGAIFGIARTPNERLTINPYSDTATPDVWRDQHSRDQSYRDRIFQFGRAIGFGPSPTGMELIAEAILNVPCDIYEGFVYADQIARTYGALEAYTYGGLEAFQYYQLEGSTGGVANSLQRLQFTIRPHRQITLAEAYNLHQVISKIKPADAIMIIDPAGIEVFDQLSIRGAWASSHYWDITKTSLGSQLPKVAFSDYQGEAWVYNHDITGALAYQLDVHGANLSSQDYQRIMWSDGTYTDFLPSLANTTAWEALLGRYAVDGVVAVNPLGGRAVPGDKFSTSTVTPVLIDGQSASTVATLVAQPPSTLSHRGNDSLRYWATPPRSNTDTTYDVLEMRFSTPHIVNTLSFEAAHFPQTISVQTYDDALGQWIEAYTQTVSDSIPALLPHNDSELLVHIHPQHHGDGHWLDISAKIATTSTSRIRVVLSRGTNTSPQAEYVTLQQGRGGISQVTRVNVPYSLAIRRLTIGYAVDSYSALPIRNAGVTTIGASSDLRGNQVAFTAYEELASGPISGMQWRCEPQPVPNAVVNYFVDTRDENGNSQVVDRFYVDPTHLGVHCTLYWSVDPAPIDGGWLAADDLLPVGIVEYIGTLDSSVYGLQFSNTNPSWIDIDNNFIQWNPGKSWWMGASFRDTFGSSVDHPLLDLGDVGAARLFFQDNVLYLQPANGDPIVQMDLIVAPNVTVNVIFGWLATGNADFPGGAQWVLQAKVGNGSIVSVTGPSTHATSTQPNDIRIGASFIPHGVATGGTPPTFFEGFESGVGGAISQNSSSGALSAIQPSQSNDFAHTGSFSLKNIETPAGFGTDGFLVAIGNVGIGGATYIGGGFAATAGDSYQATAWFYCAESLQIMYGVIGWYDVSNNLLSPSTIQAIGATSAATWTQLQGNVTAPTGAVRGVVLFEVFPYFPITPDPTITYFDDVEILPITTVHTVIEGNDFESGIGTWNSIDSTDNTPNPTQPVQTTEQAHTGTHSLKIVDDTAGTTADGLFARDGDVQTTGTVRNSGGVAVTPGELYELNAWVYPKSPLTQGSGFTTNFSLAWFDNTNTLVLQQGSSGVLASLDTWTNINGQFTAPAGAAWLVTDISMGSHAWFSGFPQYGDTSVSYIDDFTVTHITYVVGGPGSAPDLPPISGMILNALVLKGETLTASTAAGFMADPGHFTAKGQFHSQDQHGTDNAYLRLDPSFFSPSNPGGLVGGPPYFCDGLTWTPIPRDFVLTKGYLSFDPTLASFWKFEMTNLAAEPFEGFLPIPKVVKTFPNATSLASTPKASPLGYQGAQFAGIETMGNLGQGQGFDSSSVAPNISLGTSPAPSDFLPTEALVAHDPATAHAIGLRSWIYNFTSPGQGFSAPRFTTPGLHAYSETEVPHTGKVGYFCGFKNIQALRLQFNADDDSSLYDEKFYDGRHIGSYTNITQNPGDLFSPGTFGASSSPSVAVSDTFFSNHDVEGVQFATSQTPTIEIVTDDDFLDPALNSSSWSDSDSWHKLGDANISYDQRNTSAIIDRSVLPTPIQFTQAPDSIVVPPVWPIFEVLGHTPATPPSFVDQATAAAVSPSLVATVTVPSTVQVGDLMIFSCYGKPTLPGGTLTGPGVGWTALDTGEGLGTYPFLAANFYRIATSGDVGGSTTYTASISSNARCVISLDIYRGQDPIHPINAHAVAVSSGDSTPVTAPVVTTTVNNCTITEGFAGFDSAALTSYTMTGPATQRNNLSSDLTGGVMIVASSDQTQTTAGNTTPEVATPSNTSAWVAFAVALAPIQPVSPAMNFGGIASALAEPGAAGMVHISVRFTALTNFEQPVYVQLIDGTSETLIAQWPVSPVLNQVVEQYWSYDLSAITTGHALRAAMVQYGSTNDSWSIDTLSIFDDGIQWSFSTDGGATWWKDLGARNLSSGAIKFPIPGNELQWKVSIYRQGMHVNHLRIRPIYRHLLSSNPQGIFRGPNISPFDHEPDVFSDPLFNGWNKPIPQWWFLAFRNQINLFPDGAPIITQFQRFFARTVADDISGSFADAPTSFVIHNSHAVERLDLTPLVDSATRTATYNRGPGDVLPSMGDSATAIVTKPDRVSPMVAPVPASPVGPPLRT